MRVFIDLFANHLEIFNLRTNLRTILQHLIPWSFHYRRAMRKKIILTCHHLYYFILSLFLNAICIYFRLSNVNNISFIFEALRRKGRFVLPLLCLIFFINHIWRLTHIQIGECCIFWSLTLIISFNYIKIICRGRISKRAIIINTYRHLQIVLWSFILIFLINII